MYKVTNGEMDKLTNLSSFLSIAIKKKFLSIPNHQELIADIESLNYACLDFHEQVKCYKHDLAHSLQMLFECYNVIFLRQYQTFFMTENKKEKIYSSKLSEVMEEKQRNNELQQQSFYYKQNYDVLMARNENEINRLQEELDQMEHQNQHLIELNESNKQLIDQMRRQSSVVLSEPVDAATVRDKKKKKNEVEVYEEELHDFVKKMEVS